MVPNGEDGMSKLTRLSRVWLLIVCLLSVVFPASKARTGNMSSSTASSSQDADKQKLIEIEKALADNPASGPPATAVAKRYLYDGPLNHLTNFGRFGSFSKSKILEGYMQGKPFVYPSPDDVIDNKRDPSDPTKEDPSDPHIKHSEPQIFTSTFMETRPSLPITRPIRTRDTRTQCWTLSSPSIPAAWIRLSSAMDNGIS